MKTTTFLLLGLLITQIGLSQTKSELGLEPIFNQNSRDGLVILKDIYDDSLDFRVDTIYRTKDFDRFHFKTFNENQDLVAEGRFHIHKPITTSKEYNQTDFESIFLSMKKDTEICLLELINYSPNNVMIGH